MNQAAASFAQILNLGADHCLATLDRLEDMSRVVAMLAVLEASKAEIEIGATFAGDEFGGCEFWIDISYNPSATLTALTIDAAVAGTLAFIVAWADRCLHDCRLLYLP